MMRIICVGGATIDYKLKSIEPLELGSSNPIYSFQSFGGVAHNVACNLAFLIAPRHVYLQCVLGDDLEGENFLKDLASRAINTERSLILKKQNTARYYAVLDAQGELHTALADMHIYEHIPVGLFVKHWANDFQNNLVFIDTNLPRNIIVHAIKLGATPYLCIDAVSVTKSAKLPYDMHGVYLLKTDQHEASALAQMSINSIEEGIKAAKVILQRGMENLLITLGAAGYLLANQYGINHFPAIPLAHITDVSGAGDAFVAALLAGLQHKISLHESCQLGAVAAYYTLQSNKTVAVDFSFSDLECFSLTV